MADIRRFTSVASTGILRLNGAMHTQWIVTYVTWGRGMGVRTQEEGKRGGSKGGKRGERRGERRVTYVTRHDLIT